MPRWIMRALYAVRGKRRVRLHITTGPGIEGAEQGDMTFEGVELGVWGGFHVLILARILDSEETSTTVAAKLVEIPAARVIFREVLR